MQKTHSYSKTLADSNIATAKITTNEQQPGGKFSLTLSFSVVTPDGQSIKSFGDVEKGALEALKQQLGLFLKTDPQAEAAERRKSMTSTSGGTGAASASIACFTKKDNDVSPAANLENRITTLITTSLGYGTANQTTATSTRPPLDVSVRQIFQKFAGTATTPEQQDKRKKIVGALLEEFNARLQETVYNLNAQHEIARKILIEKARQQGKEEAAQGFAAAAQKPSPGSGVFKR